MRVISTRTHGVLDYLTGLILVAAPWLLGFADGGAETIVPVALGLGALAYSLFTDYELGLVRRIPMPVHLMLDLGSGLLLAASPWLFGFADGTATSDGVWVPHLALGLFEIGAALTTKRTPADLSVSAVRAHR
ncbi:MAG TPA: hypothetical protein VF594_10220 [Rubricoccaceae bacterium]|jgi:hypothetical protein